jgi:putative phage-type endonuclease
MRTIDCIQGSAEWLQARAGKITASRIADVLAVLKKGGEGADRRNYRFELLAERLTGRAEEHYISKDMEYGTEWEPYARTAYELERGAMVDTLGFALHPTLDYAGASPDGLVGLDGMIEIKCPRATTHLKWMLAGAVPEEHEPQLSFGMLCCERQWCDFISYCPDMPDGLKLFIVRVERNDERLAQIEQEVIRFNGELKAILDTLTPRIVPEAAQVRVEEGPLEGDGYLASLMDAVGAEIIP